MNIDDVVAFGKTLNLPVGLEMSRRLVDSLELPEALWDLETFRS